MAKALAIAARAGALENVNINLDSIQDAAFKAGVTARLQVTRMTDLAVLNCRQLVTLAGPPGPRSGARHARTRHHRRRCPAHPRRPHRRRRPARGDRGALSARHRNRRRRRPHRTSRLRRRPHPSGLRRQPRRRVRARVDGATYAEIAAAGGGIRVHRAPHARRLRGRPARRRATATRTGSCAAAPPPSKPSPATASPSKPSSNSARHPPARTPIGRLRCVPTFLGAHEVPDEYRGRIDEYVDLVIHEMLPRVVRR